MNWNPIGTIMSMDNYEERVVARDNYDWGFIDTAAVSDVPEPFETAVAHELYGEGSGGGMVIVESYHSKKAAQKGHKKWVKIMTTTEPEYLEQKGGHDYRGTKYYRSKK